MRTGVYFCHCGGIITELLDSGALGRGAITAGAAYFKEVELACSEEGRGWIAADLRLELPDRVVIAACSPREHEETFRKVMAEAGLNPFLAQLVNIREHAAWVTEGAGAATEKALHQIKGAIARVAEQEPLERQVIEVSTDTLVVGGGPAGLKAALTLAEAGRKVVLIEKAPILGGMPLRYEEVFPSMECGPCLLEPFIAGALHGPFSENIEVMLTSEVVGVKGSFGNFEVKIRKNPRFVDLSLCVGCAACIEACPARAPNPLNNGMGERRAMDFVFFGGLPNAPYLDQVACTRFAGGDGCRACLDACPVEGAVVLEDQPKALEVAVGAIILAVGAETYDASLLHALGYGTIPGVVTALEMERMFASNGPTQGMPELPDGSTPGRIAFIHCAGSLDEAHKPYCSGICCMDAFKLSHLASHKIENVQSAHYHRTLVMPGKTEAALYRKVAERARFIHFDGPGVLSVSKSPAGKPHVVLPGGAAEYDMVVLMTPLTPSPSVAELAAIADVPADQLGFFEELHGRVDATSTRKRGIFIAGTCQGPMDLAQAMNQGLAAAGSALASLVPGRKVELPAEYAVVDAQRCSGCRACVGVCPYGAVSFDASSDAAVVNPALCVACGTCVAACPASAIRGRNFTDEQLFAEIRGVLS